MRLNARRRSRRLSGAPHAGGCRVLLADNRVRARLHTQQPRHGHGPVICIRAGCWMYVSTCEQAARRPPTRPGGSGAGLCCMGRWVQERRVHHWWLLYTLFVAFAHMPCSWSRSQLRRPIRPTQHSVHLGEPRSARHASQTCAAQGQSYIKRCCYMALSGLCAPQHSSGGCALRGGSERRATAACAPHTAQPWEAARAGAVL